MKPTCHDAQDEKIEVWRSLRARIGKAHAIGVAQIAERTGLSQGTVKSHIKALRDEGFRIGYSRTRPVGYYIIASRREATESTRVQHRAVVAMIHRECVLRGLSVATLLSEFAREIPPADAADTLATKKQVALLSRLILSSLQSDQDADHIYQLIASPRFSKADAAHLIDQLLTAIDQRNQNRTESKERRLAYHEIHHQDQPEDVLKDRDVALTKRNWDRALLREQAEQAGKAIFEH